MNTSHEKFFFSQELMRQQLSYLGFLCRLFPYILTSMVFSSFSLILQIFFDPSVRIEIFR